MSRGKCGLSTCTTYYLVAMATADLLLVITHFLLYRINMYYFPGSFVNITPVCSVIYAVSNAAGEGSVWLSVTFTIDRFVAICCRRLKAKYCTKKTAALVLATTCSLICLETIPLLFTFEPGVIIDNVPFFCVPKSSFYTEPGWVGYEWFDVILTPLIPFALILLLNVLTVSHILVAIRVRKGLKSQSKVQNHKDPEMDNRRKSVILLFAVSGSFILLWSIDVINFFYYNIIGASPISNDSLVIFEQTGYMLANFSFCSNTFIYMVTQSKFREQLKSALRYPVTSIRQLINKENN
ncbi:probable G-protein coupled receptor 139 [Heterodontus francisci]|uniref:probable G-protein coupled receptor 139 n=1 Tax=Heterodontus francisci TaxID=7792 RepID=UPI00355C171E